MKDRAVNRNRCCVAGQKGSRSGGRDADSSSCAWLSSTTCSVASPPPLNSSVPYSTSFSHPHPSAEPFLPEVFSRFSQLPQPMSWVASLSPGRRFSHPFCASASEMPSRTAGTWKWIIRCSCYPRVTMKPKRGLLPQCESAVVVKGLGNCLLQQRVSDEFYGARRGGGTAEKKPP